MILVAAGTPTALVLAGGGDRRTWWGSSQFRMLYKEARLRLAAKGSSGDIATQRSPPTCRATDGPCRVDRTSCGLTGNVRLIGPFAANNN